MAGVAFLGQGVLWVIAGAKRDQNMVYNLFKTVTSPVMQLTRAITPRIIIDAHIGLVAFFRALTPELSLSTLVLACTIFVISQAVSITPGSVGTYEGFFLLVLSTFGARPAALVTAVAVLSHVGNIAALLGAGAVGALWLRVNRPALPVGLERSVPG